MSKIKVHELAKELNIKSKDIIGFLQEKGVDVKAAQSGRGRCGRTGEKEVRDCFGYEGQSAGGKSSQGGKDGAGGEDGNSRKADCGYAGGKRYTDNREGCKIP